MSQDSTSGDSDLDPESAADQIFDEWQELWNSLQSAVNGWSQQDVLSTNRGQRTAEYAASVGELSGRLTYLWTRGAMNLSRVYGGLAVKGVKGARKALS